MSPPEPTPTLGRREFFKMTGSGNDFVFFDNRRSEHGDLANSRAIDRLCDRRLGIGADGIVLIDSDPEYDFGMRYFNRDGSLAEMCGNAALCSIRLLNELGAASDRDLTFRTPSGPVTGRLMSGARDPELNMVGAREFVPILDVPAEAGEQRLGYVRVGVPHVVVVCDDVDLVELDRRGRQLRHWPAFHDGANANFVSRKEARGQRAGGEDRWSIRTFERGVEQETLACGTGAVAAAELLALWGLSGSTVAMQTASGCPLLVTIGVGATPPVLSGEGRLVYRGTTGDLGTVG